MIDEQLRRAAGDPVAELRALASAGAGLVGTETQVAIALIDMGRRNGFAVDLVASDLRVLVAHHGLTEPYTISPAHECRIVDARDFGETFHWTCEHELAETS